MRYGKLPNNFLKMHQSCLYRARWPIRKQKEIAPALKEAKVIQKKGDATVWQKIGQALMMRAGGSVQKLLADHDYDANKLMDMLKANKTTFPVLSGEQTAPRWLWGLAQAGGQPIQGSARLGVPVSPNAARALASLEIEAEHVSAEIFTVLDRLGRHGCRQQKEALNCPAAGDCPVAKYCRFGCSASIESLPFHILDYFFGPFRK